MTAASNARRGRSAVLVAAVCVAAVSGLLYELTFGTVASYLLGGSVTQFSLVIGLFLTAMGAGAYASRFIKDRLVEWLIGSEIAVGLIGGTGALLGYFAFAFTEIYRPLLWAQVMAVGVLVGLEIPLVLRILKGHASLRVSVANILAADYLGALVASLAFPFLLMPHFGLVRAGLLAGAANLAVAVVLAFARLSPSPMKAHKVAGTAALTLFAVLFVGAGSLTSVAEQSLYQDAVLLAETTPYQRIVVTQHKEDTRLYLNGHLQFSSIDEHRYHEALVHPGLSLVAEPRRVLVLGGGDGLGVREVLKHPVEHVDLVDLDPAVTTLFRDHPQLAAVNGGSLSSSKVTVHNQDAMRFLEENRGPWDAIFIDLPDPSDAGLAKLYTRSFYKLAASRLRPGGIVCTQATSPFRAREAFWAIVHTLERTELSPEPGSTEPGSKLDVTPYQTYIPTFGTWGFALAQVRPAPVRELYEPKRPGSVRLRKGLSLRFLTDEVTRAMLAFPKDISRVPTPVSTLDDPVVVELYQRAYARLN